MDQTISVPVSVLLGCFIFIYIFNKLSRKCWHIVLWFCSVYKVSYKSQRQKAVKTKCFLSQINKYNFLWFGSNLCVRWGRANISSALHPQTLYCIRVLDECVHSATAVDTRHRWDSRLSNRPVSSVDRPLWNLRRPTTVRGGSNSLLRCARCLMWMRCNRTLQTTETCRCRVQGELLLTVSSLNSLYTYCILPTPNSSCSCYIPLSS